MDKSQKKDNQRKWSIGVFFRRKKKNNNGGGEDCSSSEEDRKAGFNPQLSNYLTPPKSSIVKSNDDNILEQQLHAPSLRNRAFNDCGIKQKLISNPNADGIHTFTNESECKRSMEYITTPDRLINRSTGSLDRRMRKEKIRGIRICPKSNSSNDEEEMVSGNSSIISRFHSDESVSVHNRGVMSYNINNQVIPSNSRKSRSARTERYIKRMSRGDVDSNKCPIYASQQVGRWKTQPIIHRQYFGSNIAMEKHYKYGSEHNNQFGLRNSSSLTNVPGDGFIQRNNRNPNWDSIDYLRKNKYPDTNNSINDKCNRSVSYENYMHRVSPPLLAVTAVPSGSPIARTDVYNHAITKQQPAPPPPPRDPERRLKINNSMGESRPVSYAFDNSNAMADTVGRPQSINNRSISDDKLWGSTHSQIVCLKKRPLTPQPDCNEGGRLQINKRFITRMGVDTSPRSKNAIYMHQNDNVSMQQHTTRINKNGLSSSSALTEKHHNPTLSLFVAPKLSAASVFWKKIDEAESSRRCMPTEMKPRPSSHSRASAIIYDSNTALNDLYVDAVEKPGDDIINNPVNGAGKYIRTIAGQRFINHANTPSRTLNKYSVNEFEFLNKTKSMPNYYGTKKTSLATTPVNKYEEHVARTISKLQKPFNYKSKTVNYVTKIPPPPLKHGVLSFQVPLTNTKKSIELRNQKPISSAVEDDSKIERKSTNLEDAINELEEIYKSLHLGDEDILDGAHLRDVPTPIALLQRTSSKRSISDEDIDDESNAGVPDIILDDLVYRNIKHSNSSPKVVDTQPPFGIPLGPVSQSPTTDYLHALKSSDSKTFISDNLRYRSPDTVSDDLAIRSLRKDNCSPFKKNEHFVQSSAALVNLKKKQRAMRSQSANIYNLIQRDAAKPSGGTFDDYLLLDHSKLSKTESLKNICNNIEKYEPFKINQDHPSNLLILKRESDNRKYVNSLKPMRMTESSNNVNSLTQGGFGPVFKLPSTLKTSPISSPYISQRKSISGPIISYNPYHMPLASKRISPDIHSDNTNMEELLNAIAKKAQESSEKLSRDLIELRKESKLSGCSSPNLKINNITNHSNETNDVCSKIVINHKDVVSRTDKLNEEAGVDNVVNYEQIDMLKKRNILETTNAPYHETCNETRLLKEIHTVSNAPKPFEQILVGVVQNDNFKMNTELTLNISIMDHNGKTTNELNTEKSSDCSTSVGYLFKESIGRKENNIDVMTDRCMNQITTLGELQEDIVLKVSAPILSDNRTIDDGNIRITEIQTSNLPINISTYDCHDYDNLITDINRPLNGKLSNILATRDHPRHINSYVTNEQAIQKEIDTIMKECAEEAEKIKGKSSLLINGKRRSSEDELNIILLPEQQKQPINIDKENGNLFLCHQNRVSSPIFVGGDHLKNASSDCLKNSSAITNRLKSSSVTSFCLGEESSSEYIKSSISSDNHQLSEDIKTTSTTSYDVKSTTLPSINDDDSIVSSVISSLKSRTVSPTSQSPAITPSLLEVNESQYNSVEELALIFGIKQPTSSLEQSPQRFTPKNKDNQCSELLSSIFHKRNLNIKLEKDPEQNATSIYLQHKPKTISNFKNDLRPKSVLFDIINKEKGSSKLSINTDMEPFINHSDIVNQLQPTNLSAESLLIQYQEVEDDSLIQYNKIKRNLVVTQPIKNNTIKSNLIKINKCDVYNKKYGNISKVYDTKAVSKSIYQNKDAWRLENRNNSHFSTSKTTSIYTMPSPSSATQFPIKRIISTPMIKRLNISKSSSSTVVSKVAKKHFHIVQKSVYQDIPQSSTKHNTEQQQSLPINPVIFDKSLLTDNKIATSKNISQSIIRTTKASRLRTAVLDKQRKKGMSIPQQTNINNSANSRNRENVSAVKNKKDINKKLVPFIDVVSVSQILNDVIYPIDKMNYVTSVTIPNNQISDIVTTDMNIPEDPQLTTEINNEYDNESIISTIISTDNCTRFANALPGGIVTLKPLSEGNQERDKSSKRKSYLNCAHNEENMSEVNTSERHGNRCVLEKPRSSPVLSHSKYAPIFKDVSLSPRSLSNKQQQQSAFTQLLRHHKEPYKNEIYTSSKYLFMANDKKKADECNRSNTISPAPTQTDNLECRLKQQVINRNNASDGCYSSKNVVETFTQFNKESNYLKKNKRLLEVARKMDAWKERTKSEMAKIEKIASMCKGGMRVINHPINQDGGLFKQIEFTKTLENNFSCSQTNCTNIRKKINTDHLEQNIVNKSFEAEISNKTCDNIDILKEFNNNDVVHAPETSDLNVVYNQLNTITSKQFDLVSNIDKHDDIKNNFHKSQIMKTNEKEFVDQLHKDFNADQVIPYNNQSGDILIKINNDSNINNDVNVPYFEVQRSFNLKRNNSNESISKSANYFQMVSILKKKDYHDSNSASSSNASPVTLSSSIIDTSTRSLVGTATTNKQGILKKRSSLDESRCSRSYSPDDRSILVKTVRRNSLGESQHGILKQHPINDDIKNDDISEICCVSGYITSREVALGATSNAPGTIFVNNNNNMDYITPYHGILKKKSMSFDNCPKHVSISEAVILATAELNKYEYMSDNNEYDIKPILKSEPPTTNTPRPILKKINSLESEEIRPILKPSRKNSREEYDDNDEFIRSILKIESTGKQRRCFKGDPFETNVVLHAKNEIELSENLEIQQSSFPPQRMLSIKPPLISVAERIKIVERALSTDNTMNFRNHRIVNKRNIHRERFKTQPITIDEISSAKTSYNKICKPISSDYIKILHRQESFGNSTENKLISVKSDSGVLKNQFPDMLQQSVNDDVNNDNTAVQKQSSLSGTKSSIRAHANKLHFIEKTSNPVSDMDASASTKAPIVYVKIPATTMIIAQQTAKPDGVKADASISDDSARELVTSAVPLSSSPSIPLLIEPHISKSKPVCVHLFQKDLNSELKSRLKQSTRSSVMNLKKLASNVDTIPSSSPIWNNHSIAQTLILPNRSSVISDNKCNPDSLSDTDDCKDLGRLLRNVQKEDVKPIDNQMSQYWDPEQQTNVKQRHHDDTLSIVNSLSNLNMGEMNNDLKPTSASEGESSGGREINEIIKNSVITKRKKIGSSTKNISKSRSQSQFSSYSILESENSKLPVFNVDCKFDDIILNNEQDTENKSNILSRDSGLFIGGVRRSLTQAMRPGKDQIMNGGGGSIAERLAALQKSGEDAWRKRILKTNEIDEIKCDISVPDTKLVSRSSLQPTPKMESTIKQCKLEGGNVYDRLTKIQNASESWKNRIEPTDATKFTVAGRLQEHFKTPVIALQFNKSNMKMTPEKTILRSSNPTPLGLAKSPSMLVASTLFPKTLNTKSSTVIFNRSLSLPREENDEHKSQKMVGKPQHNEEEIIKLNAFNSLVEIPHIDDDETFAKFFSQLDVTAVPESIELSDFDAIQVTEKLCHKHIIQGPNRRRVAKNPLKALAARKDLKNEYFEVKTTATAEGELKYSKPQESSTRTSNLAIEALIGLASLEDYKSVNLKSSTLPLNRSWLPYKSIMLLQVKGRTHVQCRLVEPRYTSVNNGDCFILITHNKLYRYIGLFANVIEKSRSKGICSYIVENKDLGCIANNEIVINGDNHCSGRHSEEFWRLLDKPDGDAFEIPEPGHNDEDDLFEACLIETNTIYEFQDESLIPIDRYWGSLPKVEILDRYKVLIFNFGSEIYVWNGKNSTANTKRAALRLAQELFTFEYNYEMCELSPINFSKLAGARQDTTNLLKSGKFPDWCLLAKLNQHMESILFKEKFLDWPEYEHDDLAINYLQSGDDEKYEINSVDGHRLLIGERYQEPNLILENVNLGRGNFYYDIETMRHFNILTKSIVKWRINEFNFDDILEKSYAHFYSSESYIIQWIYQISLTVHGLNGNASKRNTVGRDRCAYFCWQGRDSSANEKGAAALLTVEIDQEKGAQLRISQGSEPAAFVRLFKIMYVHNGNKNDIQRRKSEWRMFMLLGNYKSENILWEVKCVMTQLRSRTSALLINGSTGEIVLWHGCKSPMHIQELSKESIKDIQESVYEEFFTENITTVKLIECKEGYESKEFCSAIGTTIDNINRQLYFSLLSSICTYDFTPRLFHFSSTSGKFECIEMLNPLRTKNLINAYPFKQESLYTARQPSLFLIDNGESLWLWQGWWPKEHSDYSENDSQITSDNRSGEMRWQSERRAAMETAVSYWNAKCNLLYQNRDTSALHKNRGAILTNKEMHTDVFADIVDYTCESDSIIQNETIQGSVVWAGLEPLEFKTIFPEWRNNDIVADINKQDGRSEAVVTINEALAQLTQKIYPLNVLVARPLPEAVDPTRLEMYLTENDFESALGVTRSEFEYMPLWKQTKLKKERDLF